MATRFPGMLSGAQNLQGMQRLCGSRRQAGIALVRLIDAWKASEDWGQNKEAGPVAVLCSHENNRMAEMIVDTRKRVERAG
jgi:hypothetical protein